MEHTTIAVDLAKSVFQIAVSHQPGRVDAQACVTKHDVGVAIAVEVPDAHNAPVVAYAGDCVGGTTHGVDRHRASGAVAPDQIALAVVIHIADATAAAIKRAGMQRPALLATRFTMEQDFYKGRLADKYGLSPVVPDAAGRDMVHRVIYDELCQGIVSAPSKAAYVDEVARLRRDEKIDGVIMGCTEITMLIGQGDFDIPVFDTTRIHAEAAVEFMLP